MHTDWYLILMHWTTLKEQKSILFSKKILIYVYMKILWWKNAFFCIFTLVSPTLLLLGLPWLMGAGDILSSG